MLFNNDYVNFHENIKLLHDSNHDEWGYDESSGMIHECCVEVDDKGINNVGEAHYISYDGNGIIVFGWLKR